MQLKYKVIICVASLLGAYAFGRFSAPEKVKTVKEIVKVKEKQQVKVVEKDVHRTTTVTEYPEGKKVTVIEDNSTQKSDTDTDTKTSTHSTDSKEVTRGTSKVTISALGGYTLGSTAPVFGGSITKPILGPVTLGAFYLTNQTLGGSLGLTF